MTQTLSSKGHILVVDDRPSSLKILTSMLSTNGYRVQPAASGESALKAVQAVLPDLILLDVSMPGMDGYQVCQRLKASERTRDIPVIFISARNEAQDKIKAFTVGGVDYITKPFRLEEVLARVDAHMTIRNLQKNLQDQVAELDAFAHTVAHDLKNPLGIVVGYSEMLEAYYKEIEPEQARQHLHLIAQAGRKASNIIDELLLLANVRQTETMDMEALNMGEIVTSAQQCLSDMIAASRAKISIPDEWPIAIGYGPWVEEIWVNYISNAIKYGGKPPSVQLGAKAFTSGGVPSIRFWVRDNGPGLDKKEQVLLFAQFTRLHRTRADGHGLGLSIVRRIAERLNGEVGVKSQAGQGSVFWFTLPGIPT
ncbi:MAG: hybrid sensor histidine kinase/response regulator [Anaerolineae bacterium]|nr:hybrid sensor histidine kinase/response regulator [Anaerolineae bacterium]